MCLQKSISVQNKRLNNFIDTKEPILKEETHTEYKNYKNLLSILMQKSKQAYYNKYFKTNWNNIKNTWCFLGIIDGCTRCSRCGDLFASGWSWICICSFLFKSLSCDERFCLFGHNPFIWNFHLGNGNDIAVFRSL